MEENKVLGKCPLCKEGNIIEKEKNFACSQANWEKDENEKWKNKGCNYSIYKFGLEKFGKKEIKADEIETMLTNNEVEIEFTYKKKMIPDEKYGVKVLFKEG
jgi:transposase-like protein